jgi:GT2 family glycosyltransferase
VIPTKFQSDGTYNILNCIKSVISIAGEFKLEFIIVYHEDYRNKFKKLKSDLNLLGFDPNSLISKMYNEVFNFSKAINLGVSEASNNIILILNDDVLIKNDSDLDHLVSHFISSTQNGVAGVRLINQDHELIHAGVELTAQGPRHFLQKSPFDFMPASHNFCREMSAVTGALMMFKKEVFFEVGGFDERFPNDYNDIEFSIRLNKIGLKVLMCAGLIGYHRESLSRGLTPNLEIQNSYKQLTKLVGMFPDRDNFLYTPATRLQISKSQQL